MKLYAERNTYPMRLVDSRCSNRIKLSRSSSYVMEQERQLDIDKTGYEQSSSKDLNQNICEFCNINVKVWSLLAYKQYARI